MNEVTIVIENGEMRFVYDDDAAEALRDIGPSTTARASSVEPGGCGWVADISPVNGPIVYGARRAEVIAAEVAWLQGNGCPFPSK